MIHFAIEDIIKEQFGVDDTIAAVIPLFLLWHTLYWILRQIISPIFFKTYNHLDNINKSYWAASMVSTIHTFIIVPMAWNAIGYLDVHDKTNIYITSQQSFQTHIFFISYLVNDLVLTLYYINRWPGWQANVIHHIVAITCWYQMNEYRFGHVFGIIGLFTEITTPFVNQRYFFDKSGMRQDQLYVINGLLMTILWFLIRVLMCGWMCYRLYEMRVTFFTLSTFNLSTSILSYVIGYILQLFWFQKIFKGAMKVLRGGGGGGDVKNKKKSTTTAMSSSTSSSINKTKKDNKNIDLEKKIKTKKVKKNKNSDKKSK